MDKKKYPLLSSFDKDSSIDALRTQIGALVGTEAFQKRGHAEHIEAVRQGNILYGFMYPGQTEDQD